MTGTSVEKEPDLPGALHIDKRAPCREAPNSLLEPQESFEMTQVVRLADKINAWLTSEQSDIPDAFEAGLGAGPGQIPVLVADAVANFFYAVDPRESGDM